MSEIAERVTARLLLADYANVDQAGKLNLIGGGVRVLGFDPNTDASAPFSVVLTIESPLSGDSPALEIMLTTATGLVYKVPGPGGVSQAVRISQNIEFAEPGLPGIAIPKGALPSTAQVVINFSNGLPLKPGYSYQFRAQLDHEVVATYSFYIPPLPKGPVIG
jgi:hypothetical protein